MKRFFNMILMGMGALTLMACGRGDKKEEGKPVEQVAAPMDAIKKIKETGKVVIGYRESSIPHSYLVNGKPVGYSMDVCANVVNELKKQLKLPNLNVEYKAVTSSTRIPEMQAGNIDMECGTTTNSKKRQEQVNFAINHYVTEVRMAVKKGSGIKELKDLDGKVVVTTTGTTSDKYIKQGEQAAKINVTNVFGKDHADSFAQVESGAAVAFIMDDNILAGLIANSKSPKDFEIVGSVLSTEPYAVMLPKGDVVLKKIADDAVLAMIQSGAMKKSYKQWFQSPIPPKNVNLNLPMSESLKNTLANPSSEGV
ncbi:amino acid ABC transporter substrate-binding protein [Hydromonas duriensis]|uniref:Amino acid ABC transporter substrate-binding protein (PAAT family) n=1 Tax=Hydromonas duriensis TaxID=1527608 RepID=A0A4V3DJH1_9BURK|nr:amino acid ABC transporter substrate-binding protein [Hydromonas duriensis]TDR29021.1 amino acid ABC transporter substrate-binding protein (PAAT family) [Hydromonas duriensis]